MLYVSEKFFLVTFKIQFLHLRLYCTSNPYMTHMHHQISNDIEHFPKAVL